MFLQVLRACLNPSLHPVYFEYTQLECIARKGIPVLQSPKRHTIQQSQFFRALAMPVGLLRVHDVYLKP